MITRAKQMSESIQLNSLLAVSGGFMDAYSYLQRDHVFANAQTGNILLFGVNLSEGNFSKALRYFIPFMAFALGIALAEEIHIRHTEGQIRLVHWRQISVLIEAAILAVVAFIPLTFNILANSLTSFACGIQVQSFRKAHGNGLATTMCIGNMRSGVHNLCHYAHTGDRSFLHKAMIYFDIILCFTIGAIIGSRLISLVGIHSILFSTILLICSFVMMFTDYESEKNAHKKSAR
jgi:uncharacterized membrane protein YoaK (UPF0700 family)